MQHNIQASIKKYIEKVVGVPCIWIYDGATLPKTRPLVTIEAMPVDFKNLTKQRELYNASYRFQVGVLASNATEAARLPGTIAQALLMTPITLLDTKNGGAVMGQINADVERITPMPASEVDSAQKFKSYIDVTASTMFSPGKITN